MIESLMEGSLLLKEAIQARQAEVAEFCKRWGVSELVIRRLEIIGEAAGRMSPEFRTGHPDIPWGSMTGMRNRMIHGYDDIDMGVVWNTSQESVPNLLALIEPLVSEEPQ